MKHIFYSMCIGSLALTLSAQAADFREDSNVRRGKGKASGQATQSVSTNSNRAANVNRASVRNSARVKTTQNLNSNARFRQNRVRATSDTNVSANTNVRNNHFRNRDRVRANNDVTVNRDRNVTVNRERNINRDRNRDVTVNRERNINRERNVNRNVTVNRERNINRNVRVNRTRNAVVTNNWRSDRFSGARYSAFRNYHRQYHNRDWWHHHHSNIVFIFGGPYYWDAGYWYPAWGYNPGYSYIYDGPIYTGVATLTPDRVVANVQEQLARDGYYTGEIDGQMGPMTRQAIADFQADNGLAVTAAVDEPTLASLGLA